MKMERVASFVRCVAAAAILLAALVGCDRIPGSKLTLANYNQLTTGMSKAQVQEILGPPTSMETKNMVLFEKTTYRWEDGKKFAMTTFKNDQLDTKDTNLGTQ